MNSQAKIANNLKALFLNCSLKKSSQTSHTQGLIDLSTHILKSHALSVECVRVADYNIPPGVQPDMTKEGYEEDQWPELFKKITESHILVIGTPIWLGEKSSICSKIIERMYGESGNLNEQGQYTYYGKVGGTLITGNEDGAKHCAMNILYSLQHLGFAIPPQADAAWLGEIGPGASYLDKNSGGAENDFTNKNVTFMTYNLMHLATLLQGNFPLGGNSQREWKEGERYEFKNYKEL